MVRPQVQCVVLSASCAGGGKVMQHHGGLGDAFHHGGDWLRAGLASGDRHDTDQAQGGQYSGIPV